VLDSSANLKAMRKAAVISRDGLARLAGLSARTWHEATRTLPGRTGNGCYPRAAGGKQVVIGRCPCATLSLPPAASSIFPVQHRISQLKSNLTKFRSETQRTQ
jgi:hypothetical protein